MTAKLRLTRVTRLDVSLHNELTAIGTLVSPTPEGHVLVLTLEHAALAPGYHAERIEVYAAPGTIFDQVLLNTILDYIKALEPPGQGDVFWRPYVQEKGEAAEAIDYIRLNEPEDDNRYDWLRSRIIETVKRTILSESQRYKVRIFDSILDEPQMRKVGFFNDPHANQIGTVVRIDLHRANNTSFNRFIVQFENGIAEYSEYQFERIQE